MQGYDAANEVTSAQAAISLAGTASAGSASASSLSVTLPGGIQANDQILVAATFSASPTLTVPAGYTVTWCQEPSLIARGAYQVRLQQPPPRMIWFPETSRLKS